MAKLTEDLDGSATMELSDGSKTRIPGLLRVSELDAQALRHLVAALCEMVNNLDNRLAALEKRNNPRTFPCV